MTNRVTGFLVGFCVLFFLVTAGPAFGVEARSKRSQRDAYAIPEAKFRMWFEDYVCERLGKERSDIAVSRFKVGGNRPVPRGSLSVQLFQRGRGGIQKHVRLTAIVRVDQKVVGKVSLAGWVDVFEDLVCAARYLRRGDLIGPDDLYLVRKNLAHLSPHIVTDPAQVIGKTAKHNMRETLPIQTWMLENPPLLERGDRVTILAESGDLRVSVMGTALEAGSLGKRIKVQNAMSRKSIYAKVIDGSTVRVEF